MKRITIYGVDPGTRESALVVIDARSRNVLQHVTSDNDTILGILYQESHRRDTLAEALSHERLLVVEQIESMGMAVGQSVFETVWWAGRFHQVWSGTRTRVTRHDVKLHLCRSRRAKDSNIRQALLDYYGGADAIGTKKTPGRLYGVKGHEFAALAVAVTFTELYLGEKTHGTQTTQWTEETEGR